MKMKKIVSLALTVAIAACTAVTAMLPAAAEEKSTPRYTVITLDTSYSMDIKTDGVSRLDAAKQAAKNLAQTTLKQDGNKVAVVTFSSGAKTVADFTDDFDVISQKVDSIKTDGATYFSAALEQSKKVFDDYAANNPGETFERNIVLCSDGTPLGGKSLETYKYTSSDDSSYKNANAALKYDDEEIKPVTNVYTIGFYSNMSDKERKFAERFMKDLSTVASSVVDNADDLIKAFDNYADRIINVKTATNDQPAAVESNDKPASSSDTDTTKKSPQTGDAAARTAAMSTVALVVLAAATGYYAVSKKEEL